MANNDIALNFAQDTLLDWFIQVYCSDFKEDPGFLNDAFRLPPEEAIELLKSKGLKINWSWKDMEKEAHAKSFTVAKAMKTDILVSIKDHLEKSLEQGWSFDKFQKTLAPEMQKKGWWGKVPDELVPSDGSVHAASKMVQLGSAWRLKTIFATNIQSAMMAGRYKAMSAMTATRPYWQYLAVMDASTRPDHARLHGRIFRHDDPVWKKIYPPNGFNCRCSVRSLSDKELGNKGLIKNVEQSNSGMIYDEKGAPIEPDAGFDYNPGEAGSAQLEKIAQEKQQKLLQDLFKTKGFRSTKPEEDVYAPRPNIIDEEIAPSSVQVPKQKLTPKPESLALRPTKPEEDVYIPRANGSDEEIAPSELPPLAATEQVKKQAMEKAQAEAKAAMEKFQADQKAAKAKAEIDKEKKKVQAIVKKMPAGKEVDDLFDEIDLHDMEPSWSNPTNSPRYGGVVFNDKGQILLRRPANDFDGYVWTFAKGGADGQKPLKAAKREVMEEQGTEVTTVGLIEDGHGSNKNNFFFLFKAGKHDPTKMDKETQDMKWVSPKEAVEYIMQTTNQKGKERDLKVLSKAVKTWNDIASGKVTYDHLKPKPIEQAPAVESIGSLLKPGVFPEETKNLRVVQSLGGTTGAKLVEDPATGKKYVMKKGASQGHLREEVAADEIYRSMNVLVPACKLYETSEGAVKLSEYIEDAKPLSKVIGTPAFGKVKAQLQNGFAADALLGNWDVAGTAADNILIDKDGNAWRIDNGGSMRYRAQGKLKETYDWSEFAGELWTMRGKAWHTVSGVKTDLWSFNRGVENSAPIQNAVKLFGDLSIVEVAKQIESWDVEKIIATVPTELKATVRARIENMRVIAVRSLDFKHDRWKDDYIDEVAQSSMALRKYSLVESLPTVMSNLPGDVMAYDENQKLWDKLIQSGGSSGSVSTPTSIYGSFKSSSAALKVAVAPTVLKDKYFATIVDALKTISHHNEQGDASYNKATIDNAVKLLQTGLSKESKSMQRHYADAFEYLIKAKADIEAGKGAVLTIGKKLSQYEPSAADDKTSAPAPSQKVPAPPATEREMALAKDLGWDMGIVAEWQKGQGGSSWSRRALVKKYHAFIHADIDSSELYWGDYADESLSSIEYKNAITKNPNADKAMTLHHAAIQELLSNTDFRFNDKTRRCVRIIRTENKSVVKAYGLKKGSSAVFKRGLNESGSVFKGVGVHGTEVTLTAIPYSRITGSYLWESPTTPGTSTYLGPSENEFTHSAPDIPALYLKGSLDLVGGKSEGRDASEWGVSLAHLRSFKK